jgi:hypothetical protein
MYQCTEFAIRYAANAWGVSPSLWHGENAQDMFATAQGIAGLQTISNGVEPPAPGDVIVIQAADNVGHVGVVTGTSASALYFVGQNQTWATGLLALQNGNTVPDSSITNWMMGQSTHVLGWVRGPVSAAGQTGSVRLMPTSDGHIQVFTIASGTLQENWYSPANGAVGGWAHPASMGVQAVGSPAVVARSGQNVIDAFVRGSDGLLRETWYNWSNGHWGGWISISGATFSGDPQTIATSDGHEQIFANANGTVEQNWFAPSNGAFGGWVQSPNMGQAQVGNPAVVARSGQSVIDVFVRGSDGVIRETWYDFSNGHWGGWISISGATFTGDPQTIATSDGHEQIFANANGTVEQNWFAPSSGNIGNWIVI